MQSKTRSPAKETQDSQTKKEIIVSIIRMSQKALGYVLAMIAVGYVGGLIAIVAEPDLADPLSKYAKVFVPVFQLEIGIYGVGSTFENVTKLISKVNSMNNAETESGCG